MNRRSFLGALAAIAAAPKALAGLLKPAAAPGPVATGHVKIYSQGPWPKEDGAIGYALEPTAPTGGSIQIALIGSGRGIVRASTFGPIETGDPVRLVRGRVQRGPVR